MSNTYTQIHIQCIFAVKYRDAVINRSWKERLHKYIIAIVNNNGHKALAISYSKSQTDAVVKYILNQEDHHRKKTFMEEYKEMLKKFEIDYNEQYIFKKLE